MSASAGPTKRGYVGGARLRQRFANRFAFVAATMAATLVGSAVLRLYGEGGGLGGAGGERAALRRRRLQQTGRYAYPRCNAGIRDSWQDASLCTTVTKPRYWHFYKNGKEMPSLTTSGKSTTCTSAQGCCLEPAGKNTGGNLFARTEVAFHRKADGWFFNSTLKACQKIAGSALLCLRCVPFEKFSECHGTCAKYESTRESAMEEMVVDTEMEFDLVEFIWYMSVTLYMCLALAIVCEEYFVAALDLFVEMLELSPDVAGATFMAAGSSAPELFVACVGTFVFHDTVGLGAVVGSTMFNTLCIIGGSAMVAKGGSHSCDWRCIARDGGTYTFAVLLLGGVLLDGEVNVAESWAMLILYGTYVASCAYYQKLIIPKICAYPPDFSEVQFEEMGVATTSAFAPAESEANCAATNPTEAHVQTTAIKVKGYSVSRQIVGGFWKGDIDLRDLLVDPEESQLLAGGASELSDDASAAEPAAASPAADAAPAKAKAKATAPLSMSAVEEDDPDEDAGAGSGQAAEVTSPSALPDPDADDAAADAGGDGMADVSLGTVEEKSTHANDLSAQLDSTFVVQGKGGEGEGDDAEEHFEPTDPLAAVCVVLSVVAAISLLAYPWAFPVCIGLALVISMLVRKHKPHVFVMPASSAMKGLWAFTLPLACMFHYTVPDCTHGSLLGRPAKTLFPYTFAMSIVYLGLLVEVMADAGEEAGQLAGMSVPVLGETFIAAGTSFPDFLASLIVAKKGNIDMAISNAFGSNIFDILLGLGVPWVCLTTFIYPGEPVIIEGAVEIVATLLLLLVVNAIIFSGLVANGWVITSKAGKGMVLCYLCWATIQIGADYALW